jgi:hypothetical protein
MARVEFPIAHRTLMTTGDKVLRARIPLELRTHQSLWKQVTFLFDLGTEMTTMPADRARTLDLRCPGGRCAG